MPFNVGFARIVGTTGPIRVFRTTAETKEKLADHFSKSTSEVQEELVDFLSFDSHVAEVLEAMCQISFVESELMKIFIRVRNAAR